MSSTIRIKPDEKERLQKAAVDITVTRQKITKASEILHRLIEEYLDDCVELYKAEAKAAIKAKKK